MRRLLVKMGTSTRLKYKGQGVSGAPLPDNESVLCPQSGSFQAKGTPRHALCPVWRRRNPQWRGRIARRINTLHRVPWLEGQT